MRKYLGILTGCRLFAGISEDEILRLLGCMKAAPSHFRQSSPILREGDLLASAAIVLDGSVTLSRRAFAGSEDAGRIPAGGLIGLSNAFIPEKLGFTALAETDADILFLGVGQLLEPCPNTCGCHLRLIRNLTFLLASDDSAASARERHLCRRTTREKLMSYLVSEASRQESCEFDIPLDRKALAEYLAVDRSAMSSELSRMQSDGLIEYYKNHFILKRS